MLIKIISITTSSLMQQVLLIITSMFPISGATIKSAGSVIASARKMDLPPVCQPKKKGKSYKENMEYHRGTSWKAKLRVAVDKAIWASINYEEFLQKMQLAGYEVRQGKHLSFRAPEQKNFTYMKSLGSYDSEENVRIRLATLANAALIQCQQLGYQVPDDVSIIGFDDLPIAAYTSPPLTTIRQDRIELGKSGFFALSSLLNGVSISTFLLHTQLIERKSTGNVPQIPLMISPL